MIMKVKVLMLFLSIFLYSCSSSITVSNIEEDLIGRRMMVSGNGWTFSKSEPRNITILKEGYQGEKATIIIHIDTWERNRDGDKYSGKIRLKYENINDGWDLMDIESLTFAKEGTYD